MGAAERGLLRQGLRYALVARLAVVAMASLVSLFLEPKQEPVLTGVIVLALNLWNGWYAYRRSRGAGHWLMVADVLVVCCVCLTQVWTTAPDGSGNVMTVSWVGVATEITVVAYPWLLGTGALAAATVVITAADVGGSVLADRPQALGPLQLWLVMEAALSWGLFLLVRRGARLADRQVARGERLRIQAAVGTARRVDENEYLATLHDTASATLLMVGAGVAAGREQWLADQAARDLEVLRGPAAVPGREVDIVERLREVVAHTPLRVRLHGAETLRVSAVDAAMLCHGTREALTNVVRHAGTDKAEVSVSTGANTVTVDVVDEGRGFDPRRISGHSHGVTRSLVERMARIGGRAEVVSSPGAGTRVRMECPANFTAGGTAEGDDREIIATNFMQGLRWAIVGMSLVILFLLDLPKVLANLDAYRPAAVQFLVLGGFLAVTATVAVATWRRRPLGGFRWLLLVFVIALTVLATETVLPEHRLGVAHWSEGDAGWWVALLFLESRFVGYVGLLAAQYVLTFVVSTVDGHAAITFPGMVNATLIVVSFQLAVGMVAAVLRWLAAPAARAAREEEQLRTAAAVEEQLHRDRQVRYAGLAETTVPLLSGLSSGAMSPADESVRRACAVEAARMRRLFAEAAAVSDPLLHELRACIELAERNGVSVSFADCGTLPQIPTQARRTLTEPAVAVLATARGKVRLTVAGEEETVTVSVIAEVQPYAVPTPDRDGVRTSTLVDGNRLWIETTWRGGS